MDTDAYAGEIIFTFDGDAAGQKAALRAFEDDQRFVAQTYIAVSPDNMDPCELRLAKGDVAVRDLVARREPLIAFALRSHLSRYDLDLAEGRVAALRATAPLVAKIKDRALRPEYARKLAGDLGMERRGGRPRRWRRPPAGGAIRSSSPPVQRTAPDANDPRSLVEREALKLALQEPVLAGPMFDSVDETAYVHPVHIAVRQAIAELGGAATATERRGLDRGGTGRVRRPGGEGARGRAGRRAAAGSTGDADPRYVAVQMSRLQLYAVNRRIADVKSKVQRINPVTNQDEHLQLFGELVSLEQQARALREQASGGL